MCSALQWRHNERDGVSNHQPHDCLFNYLFSRRSEKTSKLRVTGICAGNSLVTWEFPAQSVSNADDVSIWWRHDVYSIVTSFLLSSTTREISSRVNLHTTPFIIQVGCLTCCYQVCALDHAKGGGGGTANLAHPSKACQRNVKCSNSYLLLQNCITLLGFCTVHSSDTAICRAKFHIG